MGRPRRKSETPSSIVDGRRIARVGCDHSVVLLDPVARRTTGGRSPPFDNFSPEHVLRHVKAAVLEREDRAARTAGGTFRPERDAACEALRVRRDGVGTGAFAGGSGLGPKLTRYIRMLRRADTRRRRPSIRGAADRDLETNRYP